MRKLFKSGKSERDAPVAAPHRPAGLVVLRRAAAALMLGGAMAAGTVLGAPPTGAQSIDIFGPPPGAAPSAPATGTPSVKNPVAKESSALKPAPRQDIGQGKENRPAESTRPPRRRHTSHPLVAQTTPLPPTAAPSSAAPTYATPVAPAPAHAPGGAAERAATSAGVRPLARDMLYPLGIGFGLASELGVLWLILRWRARRAKRALDGAQSEPTPFLRKAPETARPSASSISDAAASHEEDHPSTIARLLDRANAVDHGDADDAVDHRDAPPAAARPAAAFANFAYVGAQVESTPEASPAADVALRAPAHSPNPAHNFAPEPAPAPHAEPEEEAPARGVFKPSPLFNRIQPAEPAPPAPIAPPDPLAIRFEALRLSTSASRIELRFRVTLRNNGAGALGPIRVDSCMTTPEGDLPDTALAHSLATLMPGEEAAIAEEWRVPMAMLPTLRLGTMRLLVGAARIFVMVEGASAHRFQDRSFLIGLPEEGGRLVPIPLDGGAHLYDNLLVQSIAHEQG
ncbi:hypothetical protein FHW96_000655 [Novosphingobium sp. SG751A]|uniref:hypothetical protein n=1 Tax=Novosphingobium sp. SG751A TaxID=2587000 RepID=UPI001555BF49|nr:hypothetical protein [Novosphingobium sp. SG751A]NOW44513.1 hypothetical protein [Novosphingobium sp. SG751A]